MNTQNKTLNIAIVAYHLEPGGLSSVIQNVFQLLQTESSISIQLILLDEKNKLSNSSIVVLEKSKFKKYFQLYHVLRKEHYDFIIDLRYRLNPLTEILIAKFIYPKTKIIYNVHSSRLETYLLKNKFLTNWLYGKSYKVVCGAKGNEDLVVQEFGLKNTITLYNPLDVESIIEKSNESLQFDFEYILAVGRVEEVKQFDELIQAYFKSILPSKKCKLVIVGNGTQLDKCKKIVEDLNLQQLVIFTGFDANPYKYMKRAKYFVLCSKYEGFGLVVAESLVCGTPVISFDLQTGPNEIITDKIDGLLVENQNFEALSQAMNQFFEDESLYTKCKENTTKNVNRFSVENIKKEWLLLLTNSDYSL